MRDIDPVKVGIFCVAVAIFGVVSYAVVKTSAIALHWIWRHPW